jgi:hypothetical protein
MSITSHPTDLSVRSKLKQLGMCLVVLGINKATIGGVAVPQYGSKRMFGKYKIALANLRRSPRASLQKGGTGLLLPLEKAGLIYRGEKNDNGERY